MRASSNMLSHVYQILELTLLLQTISHLQASFNGTVRAYLA